MTTSTSSSTRPSALIGRPAENSPPINPSTAAYSSTPFNSAGFANTLQGTHQSIASLATTPFESVQGALQQVSSNLSHISKDFSDTTKNLVRARQSIETLVTQIQYASEHFAERPSSTQDDSEVPEK